MAWECTVKFVLRAEQTKLSSSKICVSVQYQCLSSVMQKKIYLFFLNGITKGRRENRRTTKLITVWIFTVHLKELEHKHIQTDKTLLKIVGGVFWTYRHTITLHTYCRLVLLYISLNQFFDQFCTPEQNPRSVPEGWQQDGEHHPVLSSGDG